MDKLVKVTKGLECCAHMTGEMCRKCPYVEECEDGAAGSAHLAADALSLLKAQNKVIQEYKKADTFLDAHGWKWE